MKKYLLLLVGLWVLPALAEDAPVPSPNLSMSVLPMRVGCTTDARPLFDWLEAEHGEPLFMLGELNGGLKTLFITRGSNGEFTLIIQNADIQPAVTCLFWGGENLLPVGNINLDAIFPPQIDGEET